MADDRSFLQADIADLVRKLTTNEKISLLGAPNWWNTTPIPHLNIPSIRMSDGPNASAASGNKIILLTAWFREYVVLPTLWLPRRNASLERWRSVVCKAVAGGGIFAQHTPCADVPSRKEPTDLCATAMASTFDPELIQKVGGFLAAEAKVKSSVVLLAPTCNIQRSPLGGRAFESFSEDPHLSGTLAAAYVNGLQAEGVSATIKHFVANDQEHERTAAESVVSDRALREIYLYPYVYAGTNECETRRIKFCRMRLKSNFSLALGAFMTSYGRIQGVHCSENRELLQGILRDEWKFNGLVISDWYGTYAVDQALNAGLDLEMPGPPPLAQLAADGIVLLKNQDNLLPLSSQTKKLAIIGPNALQHIISGGGSAALKPSYSVCPCDGVVSGAPADVVNEHAIGCYAHKYLPTLENNLKTAAGEPGWLCTFYNHDSQGQLTDPVADFIIKDTRVKLVDFLPPGLTEHWTIKLTGQLTVEKTAPFELGLTVAGRAKLWVNGNLTIDNWTKQTAGDFFYGQGTIEEKAVIDLTANVAVDILVEYTNTSPPKEEEDVASQPALMLGVRLGGCEKIDADAAINSAVALAAKCDAVLFVGGLTPEWESEGFDRPTLSLPGRQDEVISKIAAANPNTIVCIQAGSATSMPWVADVRSVIQAWYLGNEVGNAIADVIWGKVNPGGRLPLTFPVRIEDTPAYLNERSENGKIHYREDLFVGYKHYHARAVKPLFPFGFGLSYTTFSFSNLVVSGVEVYQAGLKFSVSLTVRNEGRVTGSEVAQLYISYPDTGITTPIHQLKGFAKAKDVAPGGSHDLKIGLDKYALAFWDSIKKKWTISPGTYVLHVGASSEDFRLKGELKLTKGFTWQGL
ncbi:Beta-glucosidase [Mycena venus]|uniref:beta-glucosidase n=1 Tax=Mycena venus TaxID=2733690 RepID=A0A8H6XCE3_9AGAR|nr:Beta-glucosidase [Mycena venus]